MREKSTYRRLDSPARFCDWRCTAARNLGRAGVPEQVAMKLTGHATRDVFRRYNILTDADIRAGIERLAAYVAKLPTERTAVPIQATASAGHLQNTDNPGRVTRPGSGKLLKKMAGSTRLELATSGVTGRRSNQLNYDPAWVSLWARQPARRRRP